MNRNTVWIRLRSAVLSCSMVTMRYGVCYGVVWYLWYGGFMREPVENEITESQFDR